MSELLARTLTGAALIAAALLAAYAGGYLFAFAVAAIATAMFYEWTRIVRGWGLAWYASGFVYALLPAVALLWIRERDAHGLDLLLWVFLVTWSTDIGAYFVGRAIGRRKLAPAISPGKTVEGLVGGMALAALAMVVLRPLEALAVLAVAWIADTAAYFAGRRWGRRKLAPAISPGKTWEGAAGGLIGGAAYAMILSIFLAGAQASRMAAFIGAAALLVVVSIVGDLFESAAKRQAGVKDSGALLPGHGGILDRIDSATAILPVAAALSIARVVA